MQLIESFHKYRSYLFSVAYRMLGTVEDAEDILQDTFIKIQLKEMAQVQRPRAYLSTVVTRLCIDRLKELKKERALYEGPWLPDPLKTDSWQEEGHKESLSVAYLLLLEYLNPIERAVFLLREVFDHSYEDISFVLNKQPDNCRQIFSRAKRQLELRRKKSSDNYQKAKYLLEQLIDLGEKGNYEKLKALFVEDARIFADGGGKVRGAVRHVLTGADKIIKFISGVNRKLKPVDSRYEFMEINQSPAIVAFDKERIYMVLTITHDGEKITAIYTTANPEKLKHLYKSKA